jgi:hypothetical protein
MLAGKLVIDQCPKPNHQMPANKKEIREALPTLMPNKSGSKTKTAL